MAGTWTASFTLDEGGFVAGLIVRTNSGAVTAYIETQAGEGEYLTVAEWPTQYSTTALSLKQVPSTMAVHRVTITTTGMAKLRTLAVPAGETVIEPLPDLRIEPGETLIITGVVDASTADVVVTLHGTEDL